MTRQHSPAAALCGLALYLTGPAPYAQAASATEPRESAAAEIRMDTPSGYPVPRLVSLKSKKTFCRTGPSFSHPVRLTYMRQGLPVVVVAETHDHWRKIRDSENDECWTHKSKLSGNLTALVLEDGLAIRSKPAVSAPVKARFGRGLVARVDDRREGWIKISAAGVKGWAPSSAFWGAGASSP
ncbi:SH3 domain-containing protein [Hyphococcus sp.]|uniref:SH3 domain-containing protein n=1 Tax=Hyphococcus sp. TaxID=2038636 RepID=UPI003CCC311B